MSIRAENDPRFSRRFLIMGIVAIGFALWCLKDGLYTYPSGRTKGFEEFKTDFPALFAVPTARAMSVEEFESNADKEHWDAWAHYSHDRGIKVRADIITQFIMAAITGVAGLFLLSIPIRSRGRWIELDDNELRSSWGESFRVDQVESLNKRKWRDKGIAKVTYRENGRKRKFVIDDYKFMRDPTDAILFELEQRIGIEKITGGPPEPIAEDVDSAEDALQPASGDHPDAT